MSAMASEMTSLTIVYSTIDSGAVQRKRQSTASLAFVRGIHSCIYIPQIIEYIMTRWLYSIVWASHYLIMTYLIWRYWTSKVLVMYIRLTVCLRLSQFSLLIIFHAVYRAMCIRFTHFSYDDCENTCALSYYHHQIGSMAILPLFRFMSCNNGMRWVSFYILIKIRFSTFSSWCAHTKRNHRNILRRGMGDNLWWWVSRNQTLSHNFPSILLEWFWILQISLVMTARNIHVK